MKRKITKKTLIVKTTDTGTAVEKKRPINWRKNGTKLAARLRFFEPVKFRTKSRFTPAQKKYIKRRLAFWSGVNRKDFHKITLNTKQREALGEHGYKVSRHGVAIPRIRNTEGRVIKGSKITVNKDGTVYQRVGRQVTITAPIVDRAEFVAHTEKVLRELFGRTKRVTEHSDFRLVAWPAEHADSFTPRALHNYLQKQGFMGRNVTAVRFTYYLPTKGKKRGTKTTGGHKRLRNGPVSIRARAKAVRVGHKAGK